MIQPVPSRPSFWRSFPVFEELAPPVLAALAEAARPQSWPAGTVLFQRGDPGDWMVALEGGRVRLSLVTGTGRELTLRHAGPGETLGELALFDGAPRSADATALGPTRGHVLHRRDVEEIARRHPEFMQGVARYLSRRLRETTDQLESIALYSLEARLARFVLFTLRQLDGDDLPATAHLSLDISQTELATLLGASRPKVNRALAALAEAGALVRDGAAWRCDVAALETLAEPGEG